MKTKLLLFNNIVTLIFFTKNNDGFMENEALPLSIL